MKSSQSTHEWDSLGAGGIADSIGAKVDQLEDHAGQEDFQFGRLQGLLKEKKQDMKSIRQDYGLTMAQVYADLNDDVVGLIDLILQRRHATVGGGKEYRGRTLGRQRDDQTLANYCIQLRQVLYRQSERKIEI